MSTIDWYSFRHGSTTRVQNLIPPSPDLPLAILIEIYRSTGPSFSQVVGVYTAWNNHGKWKPICLVWGTWSSTGPWQPWFIPPQTRPPEKHILLTPCQLPEMPGCDCDNARMWLWYTRKMIIRSSHFDKFPEGRNLICVYIYMDILYIYIHVWPSCMSINLQYCPWSHLAWPLHDLPLGILELSKLGW